MNPTASEGSVARARAGVDPLLARARNPRSPRAFPHLLLLLLWSKDLRFPSPPLRFTEVEVDCAASGGMRFFFFFLLDSEDGFLPFVLGMLEKVVVLGGFNIGAEERRGEIDGLGLGLLIFC